MLYISHNRYDLKHFMYSQINTLRSRQNGRPFPDDIFKCIFLNENAGVLIKMSLKFVPKVQINNIPALVQIMAWRRPGANPLSEPMMVSFYSTGEQIVSCTLSDDSVLSESTGLFNPVLCVSQWNLFWQKNQPMRLCLSNQVRSAREWFPSPLGDFIRLFEGLIGELFQIWHWNMFYFFKWHQSGP